MRLRDIVLAVWLLVLPLVTIYNMWHLNSIAGDDGGGGHGGSVRNLASAGDNGKAAAEEPMFPAPDFPCDVADRCAAAAGATPAAESGGVVAGSAGGCCWELRNARVRAVIRSHLEPAWSSFEDLSSGGRLPIEGAPLFSLLRGGSSSGGQRGLRLRAARTPTSSLPCRVMGAQRPSPSELLFRLRCGLDVAAEVIVRLADGEVSHYLRLRARIWSESAANWPTDGFAALRLFRLARGANIQQTKSKEVERFDLDDIDGLPLVVDGRFFVGVEHPLATASQDDEGRVSGHLLHVARMSRPSEAKPWNYGVVFGAISEPSQARRDFVRYLHAERPGRRSPMVHYNSWYDFYSYQDEGFNGGFKDPVPDPALVESLRPDRLNESNCMQRVTAFGRELVDKRGAKIDSFLWDDGWDNPESLWQFDKTRFPNRFDVVAAGAKSFGAGTGVWLSPWGGYGFPQEARVKFGKQHGWETNYNANLDTEAFSLIGSNYRKAFSDVALSFVREQGVNMFKFDGVAGDPKELAEEMEAMLGLITDLRAATRGGLANESKEATASGRSSDDIWINLTTGTWASPFFLLWADSIWRGGPDIATRARDWEPDRGLRSDGLSRRQRWIRWRNMIVYVLVVVRSMFFPISQLMIHGVILASHGDALHYGLNKFDAVDFAQEVWSFVALGLQLQELYVAPRHMTPEAWDSLAEGLKWARQEAHVLRDSHWAFGDPTQRQVYCVASWDVSNARGFVFLHNPVGKQQRSAPFTLAEVLELPTAQLGKELQVAVVKSIFRNPPDDAAESGADQQRLIDWTCLELATWSLADGRLQGNCNLAAQRRVQIRLLPTEVLVLSVTADGGSGRDVVPALPS